MNNQPAFPAPAGVAHITTQGLTMLDYFAAKAMTAYLHHSGDFSREAVASCAYLMAEAMMAERAKRGL
jgi:hypothetical protein